MTKNLLNVFSPDDFKSVNKKASNLIELSFMTNWTSGNKFARAVFEDGSVLVKQVSEDATNKNTMQFPKITSISQRTEIIKKLHKKYTQQDIAAILDISQATVSNALHIVNRRETNI